MKRQQETYLAKFLYGIQTLFSCQKHTAVGLTRQNHLLYAPQCRCFKEGVLGRCVLCWKHRNTVAVGLSRFSPPLHCRLSIWKELSLECCMYKMVRPMWGKYNA